MRIFPSILFHNRHYSSTSFTAWPDAEPWRDVVTCIIWYKNTYPIIGGTSPIIWHRCRVRVNRGASPGNTLSSEVSIVLNHLHYNTVTARI